MAGQVTPGAANTRAEATRPGPVITPATDIYETTEGLVMVVELPGVSPDSVNVALDRRVLTITATAKSSAPEGYTLGHAEYRDGNYERAFTLSDTIDSGGIAASVRDGVLRLALPKTTDAQARTIEVKQA